MSNLEVQKFAVKYDPPTFVIQYRNSITHKNFLKNIRLKVGIKANADKVTDKIIGENSDLLGPSKVSRNQILDLIKLIITKSNRLSNENPFKKPMTTEYGDLNKASDVSINTFAYLKKQFISLICLINLHATVGGN